MCTHFCMKCVSECVVVYILWTTYTIKRIHVSSHSLGSTYASHVYSSTFHFRFFLAVFYQWWWSNCMTFSIQSIANIFFSRWLVCACVRACVYCVCVLIYVYSMCNMQTSLRDKLICSLDRLPFGREREIKWEYDKDRNTHMM